MTTEYLLEREVEHVLAALMPQNRLIIKVVLHTGLRIGDVLRMTPEQLKPCGWMCEQKTGKRRRYGLPGPLLAELREQCGVFWVFPSPKNWRKHKTRQAVWADVKRAQKAFRLPENIGTHSFRKVYAVRLRERYGSIKRVQRALNHSSDSVTAIYAMADKLLAARMGWDDGSNGA